MGAYCWQLFDINLFRGTLHLKVYRRIDSLSVYETPDRDGMGKALRILNLGSTRTSL